METEIFTLCDFAQNSNGKLNIIGTFDALATNTFPTVHPLCSIAMRLRFANKEAGNHRGKIEFKHNGSDFMPKLEFEMNVAVHPNGYSISNLALNIGNLLLKEPGKYTIEFHIDGEWQSGLTFHANQQGKAA